MSKNYDSSLLRTQKRLVFSFLFLFYQNAEAPFVHEGPNHALPQRVELGVEVARAQVLALVAPLGAVQQQRQGRHPGRALQARILPLVPAQELVEGGRRANPHQHPARVGQTLVEAPVEVVERRVLRWYFVVRLGLKRRM